MLKLKQIVPVQSSTKGVSCGWSHKRILTTHSKVRADIQDSIIHQAMLIPGWSYSRLTFSERSLDDSSSQKKTVVPTRWTYSGQCGLSAGNPGTCSRYKLRQTLFFPREIGGFITDVFYFYLRLQRASKHRSVSNILHVCLSRVISLISMRYSEI